MSSNGRPFLERILTERGLATLLAVVLVGSMLWLLLQLVTSQQSFQHQMIAEAARTNERLTELQASHARMQAQLDQLEKAVIARGTP